MVDRTTSHQQRAVTPERELGSGYKAGINLIMQISNEFRHWMGKEPTTDFVVESVLSTAQTTNQKHLLRTIRMPTFELKNTKLR